VSASADQTIRLWDVRTREAVAVLRGHEDEVYSVAFSGDGKRLVSGSKDGSVRFWLAPPVPRPPALRVLPARVGYFVFSPDSRRIVTLGADYIVWDTDTGDKLATLTELRGFQAAFDFSADGRQLYVGGRKGKVRIWDFEKNALSEFDAGGEEDVVAVRRMRATNLFATVHGSATGRIKSWDFRTGKFVGEFNASGQGVSTAAISPKAGTALGHTDGSVTLRSAATGQVITNFPAHRRVVVGVAFTPEGHLLATAGEEGTAKVWEVATCREIATLKGHLKSLHGLDISPDGLRLATAGGGAEAVKLWDIHSHQELITLAAEGSILDRLAFSADGNKLAGLSNEGHVHIWRAPSWDDIRAAGQASEGRSP
jgi:WD40 repeat protein